MPRRKNEEFMNAIIDNLALSKPKTIYRLAKELNTNIPRLQGYITFLQSKGIIRIKEEKGCHFVYLNIGKNENSKND